PGDESRMAAPSCVSRDDDALLWIVRTDFEELLHDRSIQCRMIGGNQQPPIVGTWMEALLQPGEAAFHGGPHVGCLLGQDDSVRPGRFRNHGEGKSLRPDHDDDVFDPSSPKRKDDTLKNRPAAQRQRQLGTAHANTFACGGDNSEGWHSYVFRLAAAFGAALRTS